MLTTLQVNHGPDFPGGALEGVCYTPAVIQPLWKSLQLHQGGFLRSRTFP